MNYGFRPISGFSGITYSLVIYLEKSTNRVTANLRNSSTNIFTFTSASSAYTFGVPFKVSLRRASGVCELLINDVVVDFASDSTNLNFVAAENLCIGNFDIANYSFNGSIGSAYLDIVS